MIERTFVSAGRDTVTAWRSPARCDGSPFSPYWAPRTTVLFILDRRTSCPWFAISPAGDDAGVGARMSLAPAPYLGALSAVLSDLLTEEGP